MGLILGLRRSPGEGNGNTPVFLPGKFHRQISLDAFVLWCCRRLLRVPWTAIRSNQSNLKEISSVPFSHSVVFDSLWFHELQHAKLPCPSPTPGVYSNSCPSSRWCHPIVSFSHPLLPPWIFPSIRVFSNESVLRIRWPNYWSFSFSISPSNEYSGLTSFRMDCLDILATLNIPFLILGKTEGRRKGVTEEEMVGKYQQLSGHEFEQTPGDNEGQGSLACCSPWDHKKSDMTEQH